MSDTYTHGHHDSVLRSHRWRTAENSAAYLLKHLRAEMELLDVGCGPGTITRDLAEHLHSGRVIGIDASPEVIEEANSQVGDLANLSFATGDLYKLSYNDASFDVVHAHQVLQHLSDPTAALVEMRRILRPGGILAVRDSDFGGFIWAPASELLDRWLSLYFQVTKHNGAEANAGRYLPSWVRAAGFSDIEVTGSLWTFADPVARAWWAGSWSERVVHSAFAQQATDYGFTTAEELTRISQAWSDWADSPNAFFGVPSGEVIAFK